MHLSHNGCKGTVLFGNKQIFGALFFPEGLHMSEFIRIFEFRSKIGCISFTFAPTEQEWYKCEGNLNGTMFHTRGSL